MKLLREEVTSLLGKGAVVTVEPAASEEGFYSTLFLVLKMDGRMRPVINLKALNFWVHPQHFKMKGIHAYVAGLSLPLSLSLLLGRQKTDRPRG